jgi:hydrogenase maturation protein HypF
MHSEEGEDQSGYPFVIENLGKKLPYIDSKTMWQALLTDLSLGTAPPVMATRFHQGLAKVIMAMVEQLFRSGHRINGLSTVALSGGVFQNRILLELVKSDLTKKSYRVLTHKQVPTNDGGISLGQAVISAAGQIEKKERSHVSWHTWASR